MLIDGDKLSMRIFIFDRDDTLTFDAKGRNSLVNPDFILPIIESIDARADSLWAIASASATDVNSDPAWQAVAQMSPGIGQPVYAPVKRGIDGLSSRIHSLTYTEFVNVDNKPLEATASTLETDLQATALEAILNGDIIAETPDTFKIKLAKGTTREPFSFDFTFNKNAPVEFRFGQTKVEITVAKLREASGLLSSGDYKLFSILNTLDKAKLKIDLTMAKELQALGISKITAPSYYATIKPKDIIFCDDKMGCYRLAHISGFTSILANSSHAKYLTEGDTSNSSSSHAASSSSSPDTSISSQYPANNSYLKQLITALGTITSQQVFLKLADFIGEFQGLIERGEIHQRGKAVPMLASMINQAVEISGNSYSVSSKNFSVLSQLLELYNKKSINHLDLSKLLKSIQDVMNKEAKDASLQQANFYQKLESYTHELLQLIDRETIHGTTPYRDIVNDLKNTISNKRHELGKALNELAIASLIVSSEFSHDFSKLVAASVKHDKPQTAEEEQAAFCHHALATLTKLSIDIDALIAKPEALAVLLTETTTRRLAFSLLADGAIPLTRPTLSEAVKIGQRGNTALMMTSSVSTTLAPKVANGYLSDLVRGLSQGTMTVADMSDFIKDKTTNFRSLLAYALPELRGKEDIRQLTLCQPLVSRLAEEYHAAVMPAAKASMVGLQDQAAGSAGLASSSSPILISSSKLDSSSDESISISPDSINPGSHH